MVMDGRYMTGAKVVEVVVIETRDLEEALEANGNGKPALSRVMRHLKLQVLGPWVELSKAASLM